MAGRPSAFRREIAFHDDIRGRSWGTRPTADGADDQSQHRDCVNPRAQSLATG